MLSLITGKVIKIPQNEGLLIPLIERGNQRYRKTYWHFELIEQIFNQCKKCGMDVCRIEDPGYIMMGYCGFKIQTISGNISIIVNESGMIELLTQMKEGEHRRFVSGNQEENDNYNPWFEIGDSWMEEITRVHNLMNQPQVILSKSQKRRLRARRSKLIKQNKQNKQNEQNEQKSEK